MPAGIINTGSHPKALWPGVKNFWGQTYEEHQTEYTDLFDVESSNQAYEETVQITGFGLAPVKPEGQPLAYDSEVQGFVTRFVHVAYALGYIVTLEEIRDTVLADDDLRARLASGGPFLFSWMSIPSAELAAQVARLPLDGVCLDMQHGMIGFPDAAPMIAAINAAGRPALVRSLWNDPATPERLFDAGAVCVIAPMVNSRAQAEALVRAANDPSAPAPGAMAADGGAALPLETTFSSDPSVAAEPRNR